MEVQILVKFSLEILRQPDPEEALKKVFIERLADPSHALYMLPQILAALRLRASKTARIRSNDERYRLWAIVFSSRINAPIVRPLLAAARHINERSYSLKYWRTPWTDEHAELYSPKSFA